MYLSGSSTLVIRWLAKQFALARTYGLKDVGSFFFYKILVLQPFTVIYMPVVLDGGTLLVTLGHPGRKFSH